MKNKIKIFMTFMILCFALLLSGCNNEEVKKSEVSSIDGLAGTSIGVQLGTTGDIYVSDYEQEGSIIERYNKAADAIQALKQGKVECVILDESPANVFIDNNSDLSKLEENFTEEEYAICIAKDNPELTEKFNNAIKVLKVEGTLDKIIGNYIGDTTKGTFQYESDQSADHSNGTLVAATNATFEPYEYMDGSNVVGIDIDIMKAICDKLGMELQIENIEFDAIITAVESGKADCGIAGMTVTEERLESIDFTEAYTTSKQVVIVRNGTEQKISSICSKLYNNFIKDERYKYLTQGLLTTLLITLMAIILGIIVGFLVAILRTTCEGTGKLKLLNLILKGYLTIIRGTPAMIQLLIIYYVIFATTDINKVAVAAIAFGVNSSAYIAEIIRAGINSIDAGQYEAGRSMGFGYFQTMRHFIMPQAIKNVLPALGNEFIVLLKETSISGYIGIMDLTRGGDYIRSRTYEAFLPLVAVAFVYLCIVVVLSAGVSTMERRLNTDGK